MKWASHFKKAIGRFLKGADIVSEKFPDSTIAGDDGERRDGDCDDKSADNPSMEEIADVEDANVIETDST